MSVPDKSPRAPAGENVRDLASRRAQRVRVRKDLQDALKRIRGRLGDYVQAYMDSDEWVARCTEIRGEFWNYRLEQREDRFWKLILSKLEKDPLETSLADEAVQTFRDSVDTFQRELEEVEARILTALKKQGDPDIAEISDRVQRSVEEMENQAASIAKACKKETRRLLSEFAEALERLERAAGELYEKRATPAEAPASELPGQPNLAAAESAPSKDRSMGQEPGTKQLREEDRQASNTFQLRDIVKGE